MVKYLAIGPGAMGYFAFLGALTKLKQAGRLDELEEISGASAGGLLALVFALAKGDTTKALDYALTVPVKQLMKPSAKDFIKDWGLVSRKRLKKFLESTVSHFTDGAKTDMTFYELYTDWFPIKIHLASYCLNTAKTVYFSVDTTPSMSVTDAVCASIALPLVISSSKFNDGWHYMDGAMAEAIPCGPFLGRPWDAVLALAFEWDMVREIKDLKSFVTTLVISQMRNRITYDFPIQIVDVGDMDVFNFNMDQEVKLKMFLRGLTG